MRWFSMENFDEVLYNFWILPPPHSYYTFKDSDVSNLGNTFILSAANNPDVHHQISQSSSFIMHSAYVSIFHFGGCHAHPHFHPIGGGLRVRWRAACVADGPPSQADRGAAGRNDAEVTDRGRHVEWRTVSFSVCRSRYLCVCHCVVCRSWCVCVYCVCVLSVGCVCLCAGVRACACMCVCMYVSASRLDCFNHEGSFCVSGLAALACRGGRGVAPFAGCCKIVGGNRLCRERQITDWWQQAWCLITVKVPHESITRSDSMNTWKRLTVLKMWLEVQVPYENIAGSQSSYTMLQWPLPVKLWPTDSERVSSVQSDCPSDSVIVTIPSEAVADRQTGRVDRWAVHMITLCPHCSEGSKKTVEETKQALKDKEAELTQLKAELEKSKLVAEERRKVGLVPFGDCRPLYFQPALAIGVFTCSF